MKKWVKNLWLGVGIVLLVVGIILLIGLKGRSRPARTELRNNQVGIISPTPVGEKPQKMAVMADIHNDLENLKVALVRAKNDGSELVVVAGDMTINGSREELIRIKNVLDESGMKYLVVPGNHDLYKGIALYRSVFGEDYGVVYVGDRHACPVQECTKHKIILINNGSWRGLGEEQKNWLLTEVEECRQIRCMAIMHMPLSHNFSEHVMGESSEKVAMEAEWLMGVLQQNKIEQIAVGHLHYSTAYSMGGITTNIVGGLSGERNTQSPRFTEFEISKNGIEREVILINEDKL